MTVICADDFGLTQGITEGILELCQRGKINATSVMPQMTFAAPYAEALKACPVQIGLHFNLTEGNNAYSLERLMLSWRFAASVQADITERLETQLQAFEDIFGRPPDFVDGHQHVHVFFGIRKLFLSILQKRYGHLEKKPWLRQVANNPLQTDTLVKALVLNVLNIGFRHLAHKAGFATNLRFAGIYSFSPKAGYAPYLHRWLEERDEALLVMCHPSKSLENKDIISASRVNEFFVFLKL